MSLMKIALRLSGMNVDDMTVAERQIMKLLIESEKDIPVPIRYYGIENGEFCVNAPKPVVLDIMMRRLYELLLNDDYGINEDAYYALLDVIENILGEEESKLLAARVNATEGRFYIKS